MPNLIISISKAKSSGLATLSTEVWHLDPMNQPEWNDWKWQLSHRITELSQVSETILLTEEEKSVFASASTQFSFSVTPYYLSLVDPSDPNCPIRLQTLPRKGELLHLPHEERDPLREESYMPVKGVTHRYPDRAIWYVSHICAVYCRFCTRKRKVSTPEETPNRKEWEEALEYFRKTKEIREVILSGGDPFTLADSQLHFLLSALKAIPHINQIRIHTRYPVTLPMRFDSNLCKVLAPFFPIYIVTHFNHPKEVTREAEEAAKKLVCEGNAILLNQSVLLRGINDSPEILEELHFALVKIGIKPYYLHQCDEVFGSSDFVVPLEKGIEIMFQLRGRNSGITLPNYVKDLTGGGGKVLLSPPYLLEEAEGIYKFRNYQGVIYETRH